MLEIAVGESFIKPLSFLVGVLATAPCWASGTSGTQALKRMSLDDLLKVEVTSVSRSEERYIRAPAAIAVLTSDDIRRSGATTVPEALRTAPGLHVAADSASTWTIGARGFSSSNSEKLLVLSDTRSIYTPLFSGVLWEAQDYVLEDIDRIEVIRGPAAALWGENAVNGVINITTKDASQTQGLYLATLGGHEDQLQATARYGGQLGGDGYFRVFAQRTEHDDSVLAPGTHPDDWTRTHAGFRADWIGSGPDRLTVQGDVYRGDIGELSPSIDILNRPPPPGDPRDEVNGGNVLVRWSRTISPDSGLSVRAYYDRAHRADLNFRDDLDTVDLEYQQSWRANAHDLLWGLEYRDSDERNVSRAIFALSPERSHDNLVSAFVRDEIALSPILQLTLATRAGHNDFSGFEYQPTARLSWVPNSTQTVWTAISRAVRTPTRLERDILVDATDPAGDPVVRLVGNQRFDSEKVIAYEAGYRWQPASWVFVDLATFYNHYSAIASLELGAIVVDPQTGQTVIEIQNENLTRGHSVGGEAVVTIVPTETLKLVATYSTVSLSLADPGLDLNRGRFIEGSTPRSIASLRASLDLTPSFSIDSALRYMSAIRKIPDIVDGTGLPGYTELDVRAAWRPTKAVELSVAGRNLLHDHHPEFGGIASRGEAERSIYAKAEWRYR